MRQKGPDVNVTSGLLLIPRLRVMDDSYKPVSILSKIEDNISIDIISISKQVANFRKSLPPHTSDDRRPCFDFICRIWIAIDGFLQMPSGDDVHLLIIQLCFTICEVTGWVSC